MVCVANNAVDRSSVLSYSLDFFHLVFCRDQVLRFSPCPPMVKLLLLQVFAPYIVLYLRPEFGMLKEVQVVKGMGVVNETSIFLVLPVLKIPEIVDE